MFLTYLYAIKSNMFPKILDKIINFISFIIKK